VSLPNFLIIGAAKSGTTALHHYLKQHPQIYMTPQKETNFFAFEEQEVKFCGPRDNELSESAITSLDVYKEQFNEVSGEIAIGEASPWYLYSAQAAANIHRHVPEAKLIAVLRHPVERAFSSYLHVVREGREHLSFEEGLLAEKDRIAQGWEFIWHYRNAGFYTEQVKRLLEIFSRDQMRFYLYDDFVRDSNSFLKGIYEFLEVDPTFLADTFVKPNATGVPKNRLLGHLLFRPNLLWTTARALLPQRFRQRLGYSLRQQALSKPPLSQTTRACLLDTFRDDILALQDLVGRDLSAWVKE
jgi:hypothetical protein